MAIVGVNITKINAEKTPPKKGGKVSITNNIGIKKIEDKEFSLGTTKQKGLRFIFEFQCTYEPDLGAINLEGDVLYLEGEQKIKDLQKEWKEKKKISSELMEPILNAALNKCNIEALKLSQDLNLPVPVPLPKVEHSKKTPPPAKAK